MNSKNKKLFLLGMSLVFLSILATSVTVMAYPPFAAETPNSYITVVGQKKYGTLYSFKYSDGDVIHWEGEWVQYHPYYPLYRWEIKIDIFFDHPGPSYPIARLLFKFKYQGTATLLIYIDYYGSGSKTFYESSTGGAYVQRQYDLDPYKAVWAVVISAYGGEKQYLWVDFLLAGYEDPFW